ncbi:MAG TPA: cyclase family protein [Acidimicrobiales bacterium]|nr:cyclase family protein [Acidimicrobiales bacterium]
MEHFKALGERLSHWERWGRDDQRGTLNFITPERIVEAAGLVRTGKVFELSIPLGPDGPQSGLGGRVNPLHFMTVMPTDDTGVGKDVHIADDYVTMPLQGATQLDSLAHVGYDGLLYNNVPIQAVQAAGGASRNSIDKTLPGIVGRGVLADVARHRGVEWLAAGEGIEPEELDAVLAAAGLSVRPGDTLAVRTGWRKKALVEGWKGWMRGNPGLALGFAEWAHDHELAAVVSDNFAIEVLPAAEGQGMLPLHCVLIRDLGMTLGEIFNLEELAEDCAADGVYEFFLVAPPLRITGAVGSPLSPIAVK